MADSVDTYRLDLLSAGVGFDGPVNRGKVVEAARPFGLAACARFAFKHGWFKAKGGKRLLVVPPELAEFVEAAAAVDAEPGAQTYCVYEIWLKPTRRCTHRQPFDVYVGSTWDYKIRKRQHSSGEKSKIKAKGYKITRGKVVVSCFTDRGAAEEAERQHAERLRAAGHRVWQK